jgi:hypothetical protein
MKIWIPKERGPWAAAGRMSGRGRSTSFDRSGFSLSLFGLFGLTVDWGSGLFVSAGIAWVGWVGAGWHR